MHRLLFTCLLAVFSAFAAQAQTRDALVIGKISAKPSAQLPRLDALARYLAPQLAPAGVRRVSGLVAKDEAEMARLLREGAVDLFSETAFVSLRLEADAGAEILLRERKSGVAAYRTLFVVRADSPVRTLSDLAGRQLAFQDPGSTSGFMLPLLELRRAGLRAAPVEQAPPDAVRYSFAGEDEINVFAWVARGRADAGTVSNLDWADPKEAPQPLKRELRVLHETVPVIRSLILARGDLPPPLKAEIVRVLVAMQDSESGRAAMQEYFGVTSFDPLTGDARADLDAARSLFAIRAD